MKRAEFLLALYEIYYQFIKFAYFKQTILVQFECNMGRIVRRLGLVGGSRCSLCANRFVSVQADIGLQERTQ